MNQSTEFETRELKPGFGAEILGVDLASANADTLDNVVRAFELHGALLVRDQTMAPDDLIAFLQRFGELEDHVIKDHTLSGYPKIFILSNREDANGRPIGAHNDGIGWHTDYSFKEKPVKCTMLYALEVPPQGSDTLLADLCAAYDALTDARKKELNELILHHSYKHLMEIRVYNGMEVSPELEAANPDVFHPLIRTHPMDGRRALWVSSGTVKDIVGMPNDQAIALVDELVEWATQEQFVFRHKWRVGDVLIWDNRCTLHTGTLYDDTNYFRVMHRMWVRGEKPEFIADGA